MIPLPILIFRIVFQQQLILNHQRCASMYPCIPIPRRLYILCAVRITFRRAHCTTCTTSLIWCYYNHGERWCTLYAPHRESTRLSCLFFFFFGVKKFRSLTETASRYILCYIVITLNRSSFSAFIITIIMNYSISTVIDFFFTFTGIARTLRNRAVILSHVIT